MTLYYGTTGPSFNGIHNSLKGKTWFFLAGQRTSGKWYSCCELAWVLGVSKRSLWTKLPRWTEWGRLLRRERLDIYPCFEYRLSSRGLDWVERWRGQMPVEDWVEEIKFWLSTRELL